ncbi:MAG TPA: redoxin domain-containing protein [Candidatus Eisenbacteria bacterium]|nr:redoxin domain-containing protein [Candidatus Eisenbacteria bacterium]
MGAQAAEDFKKVSATSPRPDLTGTVKDSEGKPLTHANVFIYTAGPKEGVGILCPSCYADCRKRTTTDSDGRFKIESLDSTLLFRILVVAKGKEPKFVPKVDPAVKPLEVALKPAKEGLKPEQQMKGRVIDPQGKPISGAVVNIRGVSRGESTRFGGNEDLDQIAVSDDEGTFVINGQDSFDAVGVEVEAPGYAKGIFPHLATGGKVHELKLTDGVSVKGRLLKEGKPMPGVEIGVSGVEREASVYIGNYSVGTDKDGKFALVNLPPNHSYYIYGKMASLGAKGALAAIRKDAGSDGSVLDVGELKVMPGFKLAGQIHLTDGKPVPPKTRVLLSLDEAWDSVQTQADSEGRFSFSGVSSDSVSLSARIKGYRLSERNKSLEMMNFRLLGSLNADKTNLLVEFEPGENHPGPRGPYVDLRHEPLLGVESDKKANQGDIHITGEVLDTETKAPISAFIITEGRMGSFPEMPEWFNTRQHEGTKGQFDVFLKKGRSLPAIMVQAEGYLPQSSGPIAGTKTNITFALKKGEGPAGTILKPDGTAAAKVTVYLADMKNGVYVQDNDMKVQNRMYQGTRTTRTDDSGKFSFKASVDDYAILVLEEDGFAQVKVDELAHSPEVKLKPWAKVRGKLMIGARPGTNEEVHLWPARLPYEDLPRNFPALSMYLKTTTDAQGEFSFERVPPMNVQVYHSPKVKDDKMGTTPMSQTLSVALQAGEVKTVTIGGQGRPVTGRVVVNGYDGKINWRADAYTIEKVLPPADGLPDLMSLSRELSAKIQAADSQEEKARLVEQMRNSHEEAIQKQHSFYATEKGRDYYFQSKRYCLNFAEDGSFRIEDVPGGKYRLRIDVREGKPWDFSLPTIAHIEKELEIPDSPGGRSDEAFDVGKIEMKARNALKLGSIAPDFEVKTVDDKPIKLSECAGKFVLLDFWAVWCGPCVAETPRLKETYEAFKNDARFRMIGLSLDPISKTPRDYARKNELGWTMGFLGEWSKADLPGKYGVDGIPSIFLIGPDGKILARDLRGDAIKTAVERALAKSDSASAK